MHTLTLSDSAGDVVSILEVPEATSEAFPHVLNGAVALCRARGYVADPSPELLAAWRLYWIDDGWTVPVCRCLSGSTCDVSHDSALCPCRQCVAAEMLTAIRNEPGDALRDSAEDVYHAPWSKSDRWPLSAGGHADPFAMHEADYLTVPHAP